MFEETNNSGFSIATTIDTLYHSFADHPYIVALLFVVLLILAFFEKNRHNLMVKTRLFFLNRKYKDIKLPKHLIPDSNGWFSLELVLCMAYFRLYTLTRQDFKLYDMALMYLRKSHELGRRVMPLWIKCLLGVLVFSEAAVFGMVIAELGLDSVTPSQQPFYGSLIGLVLAIVLMLGTHFAGEEWHRNDLIAKAGKMGREVMRGNDGITVSPLATNTKVCIAQDYLDDHASVFEQLLNRLNTNYALTPTWHWTKGTLIFIGALMVLSFVARLSVSDLVSPAFAGEALDFTEPALEGLGDVLGNNAMPDSSSELMSATGKLSTLLIFTMIFLGIQALSIFVSRAYGFASLEGRKAYEIIRSYRSREEYLNKQQALQIDIANAAQGSLNALQQKIIAALNESGVDAEAFKAAKYASNRTFLKFIHARHHEEKTNDYEDL